MNAFQESGPPTHFHVPTPGDHYSPATGSAPMTIIRQLALQHSKQGGRTLVAVSSGTRHDYDEGECVETGAPGALPSRRRAALDAALGMAGMPRRSKLRTYRPFSKAIPKDFGGYIFLHNAVAPIEELSRHHTSAKTCLYAHNDLFRSYSKRELSRILRSAHRVICVSDFVASRLRSRTKHLPTDIRTILNGVDPSTFVPADNPPSGRPVVLFVGRVQAEKGPHILIEAMSRLKFREEVTLRIVGSSGFSPTDPLTPYERHLRDIAAPLGERVEFIPFVDRESIVSHYQVATILCIPSDWEDPCPLTLPEGMACGLPVVASRRGGIPEVGSDAVQYFDPTRPAELTEILESLLQDEGTRTAMARRARARAEELSWANQYRALVEALEK